MNSTIAQLVLPTFPPKIWHPAKFSRALMPVMARYLTAGMLVLDPFGGTGGVLAKLAAQTGARFVNNELQWNCIFTAACSRRTLADALSLPLASESFDAILVSPVYGNRMSDTFTDETKRITYTSGLGPLHLHNTGAKNWGRPYRELHDAAWSEAVRVLKPGGLFLLNISDHVRKFKIAPVAQWHVDTLQGLGMTSLAKHQVQTPRNRFGKNHELRCDAEMIYVFQK